MSTVDFRRPSSQPKLAPWTDRDLIYVRGYIIDRRTGEVISNLFADLRRERDGRRR